MTLGEKIRTLRQQLGLSQQQLAGNDFTRAFVSLVEKGRCRPSERALRLFAQRLGKPLSYFQDDVGEGDLQLIDFLTRSAQRPVDQNRALDALEPFKHAIRLAVKAGNPEREAAARERLGLAYVRARKWEEAFQEYETALDLYKDLGDRNKVARMLHAAGWCAHQMEEFHVARRYYEKALQWTAHKKSMMDVRTMVFSGLGITYWRLGALEKALEAHLNALELSISTGSTLQRAIANWNAGAMCSKLGQYERALEFTREAIRLFKELGDPRQWLAEQNLAIIESRAGQWDSALARLERCVQAYRQQGWFDEEASAYEEYALYYLEGAKDYLKAEQACRDAFNLLEQRENGVLRGRLYRVLGRIYQAMGDRRRGLEYLRFSLELFRRLRTVDEAMETVAYINSLVGDGSAVEPPVPAQQLPV